MSDFCAGLGPDLESESDLSPFAFAHAPAKLSGNAFSLQERRKQDHDISSKLESGDLKLKGILPSTHCIFSFTLLDFSATCFNILILIVIQLVKMLLAPSESYFSVAPTVFFYKCAQAKGIGRWLASDFDREVICSENANTLFTYAFIIIYYILYNNISFTLHPLITLLSMQEHNSITLQLLLCMKDMALTKHSL